MQVLVGCVMLGNHLKGSELYHALQADKGSLRLVVSEELQDADFLPAPNIAGIFVPESQVINIPASLKSRLINLAKSRCKTVVFAECTNLSDQYFGTLQELATLQLKLVTIPVSSQAAVAKHIVQIMKQHSRDDGIPNPSSLRQTPADNALVQVVRQLPKTGSVKADALLAHFGSLKQLSSASIEELSGVVGDLAAREIHAYFNKNT